MPLLVFRRRPIEQRNGFGMKSIHKTVNPTYSSGSNAFNNSVIHTSANAEALASARFRSCDELMVAGSDFQFKIPRHRSVVVGEGTRRTVGTIKPLYCLLCSLLGHLIAMRTLLLTDIASHALSTHFVPVTLHKCLA